MDQSYDELLNVAGEIESEAEQAARPGQLDRLESLANRVRAVAGTLHCENARLTAEVARLRARADAVRAEQARALEHARTSGIPPAGLVGLSHAVLYLDGEIAPPGEGA